MSERYIVSTHVIAVKELKTQRHVTGYGDAAVFHEQSLGWYLHLAGSYEAIYMGAERPKFEAGDRIRIIFEKEKER